MKLLILSLTMIITSSVTFAQPITYTATDTGGTISTTATDTGPVSFSSLSCDGPTWVLAQALCEQSFGASAQAASCKPGDPRGYTATDYDGGVVIDECGNPVTSDDEPVIVTDECGNVSTTATDENGQDNLAPSFTYSCIIPQTAGRTRSKSAKRK